MKPSYKIEGFELYHANCIDFMKKMHKDFVDLIFTEPPYNLSNGGFRKILRLNLSLPDAKRIIRTLKG